MFGFYRTIFGDISSDRSLRLARREGRVVGTARGSGRRGGGLPVRTSDGTPGGAPRVGGAGEKGGEGRGDGEGIGQKGWWAAGAHLRGDARGTARERCEVPL